MSAEPVELPSFDDVFDFESRRYQLGDVPLPARGIPDRAIAYFMAALPAALALPHIPLVGWPLAQLPDSAGWLVRIALLPTAIAAIFTAVEVQGRRFHRMIGSLVRGRLCPRYLRGGFQPLPRASRWAPPSLVALVDGSEPRLRRLRYLGEGEMHLRRPATAIDWRQGPLHRALRRCGIRRATRTIAPTGAGVLGVPQTMVARGPAVTEINPTAAPGRAA